MKATRTLFISAAMLISTSNVFGQSFANGGLSGTVGFVSTPSSWSDVPDTDPISLANSPTEATVDMLDATGPNAPGGVAGVPNTGSAFCSGLYATDGGSFLWHEGIMQTVSGFTAGNTYTISFFQAVVKQQNCIDETGSWRVYLDGTLITTTAVSTSSLTYDDVNLQWDCRNATFTATASSHTIKFIPWDDDANQLNDPGDNTGALRMGIDNISFTTTVDPTINTTGPFCQNENPVIFTGVTTGGTWSGTGITDPVNGIFNPALAGSGSFTITYTLTAGCGTVSDMVTIDVIKPPDAALNLPTPIACDSLCIQFTDLSVSAAGTITDWLWDFGDGNTSTAQNPNHCYADTAKYDISLVVETDLGCSDTLSLPELVQLSYCPVSVEEFGKDFLFYPLPTLGPMTIDLGQHYDQVDIEIINSLGQTTSLHSFLGRRVIDVQLEGAAGWYTIKVSSGILNTTIRALKQ